ncbi:MAG: alpha/beta hydrolase [Actinomycetota bacterium]|nr:alpha/beta hydrolase [Actinomycetota bacterium]
MTRCSFVWAHALNSSVAHEEELGLFDWTEAAEVARVVRYDARGHGTANPQYEERAFRWSALVDDMLWAAPAGPFVAGGTGMGSVTALFAALRAPRRVQALVLALPPPAWEARRREREAYQAAARVVERRGLPAYVRALRSQPQPRILAQELPAAQELSLRQVRMMDERAIPAILRGAASSDLPSREEVRSVVVPTLILAWEGDEGHPLSTAEELAELMVMSELHVAADLAEARRWPLLVREFLADLCLWESVDEG